MRLRVVLRATILAVAALTAAGCRSDDTPGDEPSLGEVRGRAVIIYAADREGDAREAAQRLADEGLAVALEREGPPVRERSSVAVYRVAGDSSLLGAAEDALEPFEGLEWLPFVHGGPPLTDVVVWFVSRDRDAAARD